MNQYIRTNNCEDKNFTYNEWINTYEQRNIKKINEYTRKKKINEYTRKKKHKEKTLPAMNESIYKNR